ncbi:MAG: LPXTG cell wall anchor domain-containing protein [Acidobacteriaceae bacterium]|jgi:LPXTG-motif cell wall-anchored protein
MDTTTIIRIVAGILAVAVLAFLIYRRKHAKV